tara:strand:- start:550 stop:1491 length:942 start_codon:yes stop_codon:yes gene_type:complete
MDKIGLFVIPIKVDSDISTYNDYLDFLVEAETCGYSHVYIGEHLTDKSEDIQSSLIFASALLARTKEIKVCLCALPLPHYNIKILIKQLEDLYRLSNGRLEIGFSKGALKTDADYLGINHLERSSLFTEKFKEFLKHKYNSKYLAKIPNESLFSPLLSPYPKNASILFEQGFSAITSNFVHEKYWENHINCLQSKHISINSYSKLNIAINIIPKENVSEHVTNNIKLSLLYIYKKLKSSNLNIMTDDDINKDESSIIVANKLYKEITYNQIPKKYLVLKQKYNNILGHIIINLFDCINDPCYREFILNMPGNV